MTTTTQHLAFLVCQQAYERPTYSYRERAKLIRQDLKWLRRAKPKLDHCEIRQAVLQLIRETERRLRNHVNQQAAAIMGELE